jgi:hypothetical protein
MVICIWGDKDSRQAKGGVNLNRGAIIEGRAMLVGSRIAKKSRQGQPFRLA